MTQQISGHAQAALQNPGASSPDAIDDDNSRLKFFGWYMIVVGILHFVAPRQWDRMTALAFNKSVSDWTFRIGMSETLMGVLLVRPRTRTVGAVGLLLQSAVLVARFAALRSNGRATLNKEH